MTAFTRARHLSLSWARLIQSMPPHPTSRRSILILSSHPYELCTHSSQRRENSVLHPLSMAVWARLLGISVTAGSTSEIDFLKSPVGRSVVVPEFSCERTAVWFLGHKSKPKFCVLASSSGSFNHFWLKHLLVCYHMPLHPLYHMFRSSLRTCLHVPYVKPNLPESANGYFIGLQWRFCELPHCFHLYDMWSDNLNLQWEFPYSLIKKLTQVTCPCGIVSESCFEHFMLFWCSFP
jgi:hypothetical protein